MSNPIPPVSTLKAHVVVWDETFSKDASVILVGEDGFPVAELPINLSVILFQNDSRDARRKSAESIAAEFVEKWNRP